MADTINIELDRDQGWTEIVSSGTGFITASRSVEYCEQTDTPLETLYGHHLKTFDSFVYQLNGTKVYMRGDAIITVTPDDDAVAAADNGDQDNA